MGINSVYVCLITLIFFKYKNRVIVVKKVDCLRCLAQISPSMSNRLYLTILGRCRTNWWIVLRAPPKTGQTQVFNEKQIIIKQIFYNTLLRFPYISIYHLHPHVKKYHLIKMYYINKYVSHTACTCTGTAMLMHLNRI